MDPVPDTKLGEPPAPPIQAALPPAVGSGKLYQSPAEALKAIRDDYLHWTGKLSDTSLQLSYAVIAANWAAFGSVSGVLASFWSKVSVGLVVITLGLGVVGAKLMGEKLRERIKYAETDSSQWNAEFTESVNSPSSWPYTPAIDLLGLRMRQAKTWIPLAAGISFIIALVFR
jgi:hypothetical protein